MSDIVRVLRVVEYIGPREAVEEQVRKSIHGTRQFRCEGGEMRITVVTAGEFAEVLKDQEVKRLFPGEEKVFNANSARMLLEMMGVKTRISDETWDKMSQSDQRTFIGDIVDAARRTRHSS